MPTALLLPRLLRSGGVGDDTSGSTTATAVGAERDGGDPLPPASSSLSVGDAADTASRQDDVLLLTAAVPQWLLLCVTRAVPTIGSSRSLGRQLDFDLANQLLPLLLLKQLRN